MSEVKELQEKLARSEEKNKQLCEHLELLKERVHNTVAVMVRIQDVKQEAQHEHELRVAAEQTLDEERREAAAAAHAANAARSEAAEATSHLAALQAQLRQMEVQAQCASMLQAFRSHVAEAAAQGPTSTSS